MRNAFLQLGGGEGDREGRFHSREQLKQSIHILLL